MRSVCIGREFYYAIAAFMLRLEASSDRLTLLPRWAGGMGEVWRGLPPKYVRLLKRLGNWFNEGAY
jgi:hypothetical protein